jgi:hypothetical protein
MAYTAGIDCTWKVAADLGLASTSIFTSSTPSDSPTTFSRIGPRVRQGPHQDAHRSTTTVVSVERSRTADSKLASVTSVGAGMGAGRSFR